MKRLIATIFLAVLLAVPAAAQAYQAPEVKISQDKVRVNGKSYYAHVVTERQTLYSISKAYNVSLQDIYDSNKNIDLENSGLKVGQVIFIPTKPSKTAEVDAVPSASQSDPIRENAPETASTSAAKPVARSVPGRLAGPDAACCRAPCCRLCRHACRCLRRHRRAS